ncbi:DUF386 family protein [Candidatus Woesearchaeota archaeon]|jgi:biofilm protein TabA|nr:DUF386 family protein [Candidatus Woesearchaeota archaeon]MBT6045076.1 DUF386 family protein [Candidatus Woesearchaeota archaeon]
MIVGSLKYKGLEIDSLHPILKKAIKYIEETDFSALENGTYQIEEGKMFAVVMNYDTKLKEEKKAEQHEKFIDFQYLISGNELLGSGYADESNEVIEEYVSEKDRALYKIVKGENFVNFESGMFIVLFPTDIHRPGCLVDQPENVRKVVIKISIDLLK